jgi:hypothetical protein
MELESVVTLPVARAIERGRSPPLNRADLYIIDPVVLGIRAGVHIIVMRLDGVVLLVVVADRVELFFGFCCVPVRGRLGKLRKFGIDGVWISGDSVHGILRGQTVSKLHTARVAVRLKPDATSLSKTHL